VYIFLAPLYLTKFFFILITKSVYLIPTRLIKFQFFFFLQFKTNKMQRFLIYLFLQMLYMFHAIPPTIIRSTKLYIQLQVLYSFVLLMMSGGTV